MIPNPDDNKYWRGGLSARGRNMPFGSRALFSQAPPAISRHDAQEQPSCNAKYTDIKVMFDVWLLGKPGSFVESLREPSGRLHTDGGSVRFTSCFRALVTMFATITPSVPNGATSRRSTCRILIARMTATVITLERPTTGALPCSVAAWADLFTALGFDWPKALCRPGPEEMSPSSGGFGIARVARLALGRPGRRPVLGQGAPRPSILEPNGSRKSPRLLHLHKRRSQADVRKFEQI